MKKILLAASLGLLAFAPAPQAQGLPDSPERAVMASIDAVRLNDLLGYVKLLTTDEQLQQLEQAWNEYRTRPRDPELATKFAEVVGLLTSPSAEDEVMELLRPKLVEWKAQMGMMTGMVTAMGQMAIEQDANLSPEQKEQSQQVLSAISNWLEHNDITDPERARRGIGVLCDALRSMEIETMDQLLGMSFEQAMGKAGTVLGALKGVMAVYGLPVDDWLDSAQVETIRETKKSATVRVSFEIFGMQTEQDTELVRVDGRWLPQQTVEMAALGLGAGL